MELPKRQSLTVARPVGEGHDGYSGSVGLGSAIWCCPRYFRYQCRRTRPGDSAWPGWSHRIPPGRNPPQWIVSALPVPGSLHPNALPLASPSLRPRRAPQVPRFPWRLLLAASRTCPRSVSGYQDRQRPALTFTCWPPSAFAAHLDACWHPTPRLLQASRHPAAAMSGFRPRGSSFFGAGGELAYGRVPCPEPHAHWLRKSGA